MAVARSVRCLQSLFAVLTVLALAAFPLRADGAPPIPADAPQRWWKGNLHTHTFWSDGNDFPEMVAEWYRDHGWNFLAISDHNVLSRGERWMPMSDIDKRSRGKAFDKYLARFGPSWVTTRTTDDGVKDVLLKPFDEYRTLVEERGVFLMLEAEEVTGKAGNDRDIHINVTNISELIPPADPTAHPDVRSVIARTFRVAEEQAAKNGRQVVVHVNHPNYKWGVTAEDLAHVAEERFFEVFNGVDGDNDPGNESRPSTEAMWDIASTLRLALGRPPMFGLATDDSHDYHGDVVRAMPGRGWVMVRSRYLTPDSIISALKSGDFYASSGVELEAVSFDHTKRTLSIRVRPTQDETYIIRFIGTRTSANLIGKPRMFEGTPVETTLDYADPGKPGIGEILLEKRGVSAEYTFKGDEYYVRAVVESSGVPEFPTKESQTKMAWTQPVGWERFVVPAGKPGDPRP